MENSILDVFRTSCFWAPFLAWMAAQFIKMIFAFKDTSRFNFRYFVSTGGMPSAHSSMVSALATAVGIQEGFGSSMFVFTLAFAIVVMLDASTVRRAAGQQASLLNQIIKELFHEHKFSEGKLVELLGHTRLEVFLGMVIGIFVALLVLAAGSFLQDNSFRAFIS